ncbi:uncharacterized protein G2W53_022050 [Senna tora]|uniref:Reverse transcriptase domain-containing protein n=1 Tax=Senna tora TaxID=362788 RepID=A0A834TMU8_9FABA|nr:uncharacterized protein G2W53_022050 [Senna tora]
MEVEATQSEDSTDQDHCLIIYGVNANLGGQLLNQSIEVVIMADQKLSHNEESNNTDEEEQPQLALPDRSMEGQKKKRARPFELELIEQFVRKRGRIGPVNFNLTLEAPKPKKRKAIRIEEIEKDSGTRAKRLKVTPAEVEEGLRPSHTGLEIAEVTELLESCFKGFEERNKARITSIQIQPGQWIEDQGGIKQAANEYFQQLYTSNDAADETARRQFISNYGTPKLNQGHIQHLSKPFTRLEIENALFQMHAGKAPGPDGMTSMFFQHCWDTVQEDVTRMVGSFLSRGFLLRSMNQTHKALIPKMDSPSGFKDYRPISLYNTTYKLIAKVLTDRLQEVMSDLISPFQNAFVKGRLIQDNILIASETLHYIRGARNRKDDGLH